MKGVGRSAPFLTTLDHARFSAIRMRPSGQEREGGRLGQTGGDDVLGKAAREGGASRCASSGGDHGTRRGEGQRRCQNGRGRRTRLRRGVPGAARPRGTRSGLGDPESRALRPLASRPSDAGFHLLLGDRTAVASSGLIHSAAAGIECELGVLLESNAPADEAAQLLLRPPAAIGVASRSVHADQPDTDAGTVDRNLDGVAVDDSDEAVDLERSAPGGGAPPGSTRWPWAAAGEDRQYRNGERADCTAPPAARHRSHPHTLTPEIQATRLSSDSCALALTTWKRSSSPQRNLRGSPPSDGSAGQRSPP